MKKTKNIKIISMDLFRTIVDIRQTPDMIFEMFIRDNFPNEKAKQYYHLADEIMNRRWEAAGCDYSNFKTVRTVLKEVMTELFNEIGLDSDPGTSADALMDKHNLQKVFGDAKPFLDAAGKKYTVCLSTDCDLDMIENVEKIYHFDNNFISETLQMYKLNPAFFRHIIAYYNIPPENILHVGDSKSDIIAPKQLGIQTCWLNRRNLKWDQTIEPDFEVKSLLEIIDILD